MEKKMSISEIIFLVIFISLVFTLLEDTYPVCADHSIGYV